MIESLRKFHDYYGGAFSVEMPSGSGKQHTLWDISTALSRRLMRIFLRDEQGRRAFHGDLDYFQQDEHWRDCILFYEYFHGDNGAGVGASHLTGWTALVARLIQECGGARKSENNRTAATAGEDGQEKTL